MGSEQPRTGPGDCQRHQRRMGQSNSSCLAAQFQEAEGRKQKAEGRRQQRASVLTLPSTNCAALTALHTTFSWLLLPTSLTPSKHEPPPNTTTIIVVEHHPPICPSHCPASHRRQNDLLSTALARRGSVSRPCSIQNFSLPLPQACTTYLQLTEGCGPLPTACSGYIVPGPNRWCAFCHIFPIVVRSHREQRRFGRHSQQNAMVGGPVMIGCSDMFPTRLSLGWLRSNSPFKKMIN